MPIIAGAWLVVAVLIGATPYAAAQAPAIPTESQARQYIFGGFLTGAAHAILSKDVALDAALQRRLALPPGADSNQIYEALIRLTENKPLTVRRARPEEISQYAPRAGRALGEPLFTLQAGEVVLLVQYDLRANNIPFVGDLAPVAVAETPLPPFAAPEKPKPAPQAAPAKPAPAAAPASAPPVSAPPVVAPPVVAPAAVAVPAPVVAPKPAAVEAPKPKPAAVDAPKPKPAVVEAPKPAPRPAEPMRRAAPLQPTGPCLVKPVMSDQDLANCGATILR